MKRDSSLERSTPSRQIGLLAIGALMLMMPVAARPPAAPDLYRFKLVGTPELRQLSAEVRLRFVPSPFGVSVTAEGEPVYAVELYARELPPPVSLGPYRTYVAWAMPPSLWPVTRLGELERDDESGAWRVSGRVEHERFLVMVSAEASAAVAERRGRLVLRGRSPAMVLHPDNHLLMPPAPPASAAPAADGWPLPPSHPQGVRMPGLAALRPPVAPFLPATASGPDGGEPADLAMGRPREVVRLGEGEVLDLVAAPVRRQLGGRTLVMYAFNGQYPGPLIEVEQGTTIVVRFFNRTRLPATVHWHGLRLDNRYDGVPGLTQEAVAPGESFTYRVRFPDAGIYWYHPHHREDVLQDLGLYGNLLVRPTGDGFASPVNREVVLMLDDLVLTADGLLPWGDERATHALMGRFGNRLLVNGEPSYRLEVDRGEVVRFYLTNAANARTFNVSFGGAPIKVVGSDVSLFERQAWVDSVVLAPAERYVVEVRFSAPGRYAIENRVRVLDHTLGRFLVEETELGEVVAGEADARPDHAASFARLHEQPEVIAEIDRYRHHFSRPVDHELELSLEVGSLPPPLLRRLRVDRTYLSPVEWSDAMPAMSWLATADEVRWILRDGGSGLENERIAWRFTVGQVIKLRLHNDRQALHAMQHPFHIHGQRFLILGRDGVANDNLAWKDTVLLPIGTTTDLLLELSNPGSWMAHCHIAEHLEAGMKMTFDVDAAPAPSGR